MTDRKEAKPRGYSDKKEDESPENGDDRPPLTDAIITSVLLALYAFIGYASEIEFVPVAIIGGFVATIVFELVSSRLYDYDSVRSAWEKPVVRYASFGGGLILAVVSLELYTSYSVWFVSSALFAYLVLFVLVWSKTVPHPREW